MNAWVYEHKKDAHRSREEFVVCILILSCKAEPTVYVDVLYPLFIRHGI